MTTMTTIHRGSEVTEPKRDHKPLIESMRHGNSDWGTCRTCGVECEFVRIGVSVGYDGHEIEGYWRHPRALREALR